MNIPLSLLICHFIGDFLLQSNWMALNKSKSIDALTAHCLVYCTPFLVWQMIAGIYPGIGIAQFILLTFWSHLATDYCTSRWTSRLWFIPFVETRGFPEGIREPIRNCYKYLANLDEAKRHWFFVVIGLDQLIHFVTLAISYRLVY